MNRATILQATNNGRNVFRHYLSIEPKTGRNIQNPLLGSAKQITPSFNIFLDSTTGEWRYKDFATGDKGSSVDLVMNLRRLTMSEALADIAQTLNLSNDYSTTLSVTAKRPTEPSRKSVRTFQPVYRGSFSESELNFWMQSGIHEFVLEKYQVQALVSYTATRVSGASYTIKATEGNPLFLYDAGEGFGKVYAPLAEKQYKFAWPTGQPDDYVFGEAQLSDWHPLILLAAGEKDAMTLSAHGHAAVTVGSESASVSPDLIRRLKKHCNEILVCYDADETGRKRGAEIAAEHSLRCVILPPELEPYGKDATDFYRAVYAEHLKPELLRDAINTATFVASEFSPVKTTNHASPTRLRTAMKRVIEAQDAAPLRSLFGPFWESPGISILAGEPGAAKTLLALHVAHAVSSPTSHLLGLVCDANEKTLYYDLELTDRQFEKRLGRFPFTDDLIIGDYNPDGFDGAFTFAHIAADLEQTGATLLIIDNITALSSKSTADADAAMSIMRGLKDLQRTKGISSLVIAHPPKLPVGVPLSLNHIGGSKHITNFADSVFFIARSEQGPNLRYLKQVKNRTGEQFPGVLVCEIQESETGLGFTLIGPDEERKHLAQTEDGAEKYEGGSAADVGKLQALWLLNPSMPQAQFAAQLSRSVGWVNKHLKKIKDE